MKKNQEITSLAEEIMIDITNNRIPLHNILLKASRLSLLLDIPSNVELFKNWSKYAEQNLFLVDVYKSNIEAASDREVSVSSANPYQTVYTPMGNSLERASIRNETKNIVGYLANYRAETYDFALGVYNNWRFGNVAESIFERKRRKTDPLLRSLFPDSEQRLNSIEQNILSSNEEDWKNSIVSCRTLLMDIADILKPATNPDDKGKYINRLKEYFSENVESKTSLKNYSGLTDEIVKRVRITSDLTQGGAHKDRVTLDQAEDVVLYTYLLLAELLKVYPAKKPNDTKK